MRSSFEHQSFIFQYNRQRLPNIDHDRSVAPQHTNTTYKLFYFLFFLFLIHHIFLQDKKMCTFILLFFFLHLTLVSIFPLIMAGCTGGDTEKQLVAWGRRAKALRRMVLGFAQSRPPDPPTIVVVDIIANSTVQVHIQEPPSNHEAPITTKFKSTQPQKVIYNVSLIDFCAQFNGRPEPISTT